MDNYTPNPFMTQPAYLPLIPAVNQVQSLKIQNMGPRIPICYSGLCPV